MKSKETSNQLKPVRNSYVTIMHQPIIISLNTCSQMRVQIKYSPAHIKDLIPIFAGIKTLTKVGIKSHICTRECFMCTCIGYMCLS